MKNKFIKIAIVVSLIYIGGTLFINSTQKKADFLSQYESKVLIVDFWATWCPPCIEEIPHFIALQNEYGSDQFQVIGISTDSEKALVDAFIKTHGINYPIIMGTQDIIQSFGGIKAIPTTFILDKDHNIIKKFVGYRSKSDFEAIIKPLL